MARIFIHKDQKNEVIKTYKYTLGNVDSKGNHELETGLVSDGYHTFNELYEYRMLYNAAFFNDLAWYRDEYGTGPHPVKSKRHSDGEKCFGGGWFIVVADLPTGQISNHYEMKDWSLFQIDEVDKAPEWDGHSPKDVATRLRKYLEGGA